MNYLMEIRPYNTRKGRPDPDKTALLVIDMQHYFDDIASAIQHNIQSIIQACRQAGAKIAFTRHGHLDPVRDGGMLAKWWGDLIIYGTDEWELIEVLCPTADELIIDKMRYSAFLDTNLDQWLKQNGIENLIITGVLTNCCCETTAREAFVRDYRVFFVADATATVTDELHLASLKNLAFGFAHIVGTAELCRFFLKSSPK